MEIHSSVHPAAPHRRPWWRRWRAGVLGVVVLAGLGAGAFFHDPALEPALSFPEWRLPDPEDYTGEFSWGTWTAWQLKTPLTGMRARMLQAVARRDEEAREMARLWCGYSRRTTAHAPDAVLFLTGCTPGWRALRCVPQLLPAPDRADFDRVCAELEEMCLAEWCTRDALSWTTRTGCLSATETALHYPFADVIADEAWKRKYCFRRRKTVNEMNRLLRVVDRSWLEPPTADGWIVEQIYKSYDAPPAFPPGPNVAGRDFIRDVAGLWVVLDSHSRNVLFFQRAMRVRIALHRWLRMRAEIPETLDELVPEFLSGIPDDPWTGRALRWTARVPGGMIYSPGSNRLDAPFECFDKMTEMHGYCDVSPGHPAVRLKLLE